MELGEDGKHIFYKKVPVTQDGSTIPHYEEEYRDFYLNQDQLRLKNNKLSKMFKTQKEIEKDYQDQLLNTKDMKEKSRQTKKEIKQLIEETEVAKDEAEKERKARKEAETKTAEAEVKVGEAEAKAETLASLIEKFQRGEIPADALKSISVSQFLPSSSKKK